MDREFIHPYMPNSVPATKAEMLKALGVDSIEEIYKSIIPDELLYKDRLHIPEAITSEYELRRHVMGLLNKNITTEDYCSFLGAGCYKHQIPALCDELNSRGEFLTAYCGDTYSDHGKMQAIFEYASMMGELLDTDVVSYTTYDGGQAVVSALRTALRVFAAEGTPKNTLLVPETMNPEILSQAFSYCRSEASIIKVRSCPDTGLMDLTDLEAKLKDGRVGAVFYENPSYLGFFETQARRIAELTHKYGALCIAQPEVSALGIMESPINTGADIVCGDVQPLGMHIQYGGGQAGFIACGSDLRIVKQFPTYFYGIADTDKEDTYGWGRAMNYRCSHGSREKANEYFGTASGLWCITAGIYLASMGPQGMYELGTSIIQNLAYLEDTLSGIGSITVNRFGGRNFQETVIDFTKTGKTVKEINEALLAHHIFGGKDLSEEFPQFGQSALYCVSELTSYDDIHNLANALTEIIRG